MYSLALRFSPATEHFDDSSVVGFLADKKVLSSRDHFFVTDDAPYLTLVVCYRVAAPPAPAVSGKAGSPRDDSLINLPGMTPWMEEDPAGRRRRCVG